MLTRTCLPLPPADSQSLTLNGAELSALRRQLGEQELLIKAFQAENELAADRNRQLQVEQQRHAAAAAAQLEELQRALALAHVQAERQPPPGTPAVEAARLQELLSLQAELDGAQAAAAQRERELQQQASRSHG